jgi:hypothetical protein
MPSSLAVSLRFSPRVMSCDLSIPIRNYIIGSRLRPAKAIARKIYQQGKGRLARPPRPMARAVFPARRDPYTFFIQIL